MKIGKMYFTVSITVLEDNSMEFLFGLDNLRRHQVLPPAALSTEETAGVGRDGDVDPVLGVVRRGVKGSGEGGTVGWDRTAQAQEVEGRGLARRMLA
eukprot:688162-Rhodomonas_salina.2